MDSTEETHQVVQVLSSSIASNVDDIPGPALPPLFISSSSTEKKDQAGQSIISGASNVDDKLQNLKAEQQALRLDPVLDGLSTVEDAGVDPSPRGLHFWLVFVALSCCTLLSALDLAGVGTAAPTIVADLHGVDFAWVGSAYTLSSAALLPLSGNLAQIFGRRPITLLFVLMFAAGSALCGAAPSMTVLIVGRAIQGVGGGGTQSLVNIVIADLVPLRERGMFTAITGMIWSLGSVGGPFIAGSLAQKASWRWLFYLNLPLCVITTITVAFFLNLHTPRGNMWEKLLKVDWMEHSYICLIGLLYSWPSGGGSASWSSATVLAPLIVGFVGLGISLVYEAKWAAQPTIPAVLYSNRNSLIGYLATFIHGVASIAVTCEPTWFQSVRTASPIQSGLYFLPMMITISPSAILEGILVAKTGRYRIITLIGWVSMILGLGLFIDLRISTSLGLIIFYQLVLGVGIGFLYATTFIVLAPLPLSKNASAVSLLVFMRTFPQAWGVAVGGAILQNQLRMHLPSSVIAQFPDASDLVYQVIPAISGMVSPQKEETEMAFLLSMRLIWIVMAALCGIGLLCMAFVRDIPLARTVDSKWGMQPRASSTSVRISGV
ncbi:MFS general substrate transporter [Mycena rosella]|uniref:MFS general substrate transporter n=1 Tax=Mycena rosella TaxID=1033263 RepID=A0AAD7H138_MYCRO|nr:MFS general substrate transporter [Mycena rosella]